MVPQGRQCHSLSPDPFNSQAIPSVPGGHGDSPLELLDFTPNKSVHATGARHLGPPPPA